jgi:heparosan-N-sulfate-glucuronate 5-epimerase
MLRTSLHQWTSRLHHWYTMFSGTSYYHQPQLMGRVFVPGELKGYFNDLTGKTNWKGKIDENGIPINTLTSGKTAYLPVLLCQKALGHWDLWLTRADQEDRRQFLKIAAWLTGSQDAVGGWDTFGALGKPAQYRYSAMTQGEAISVMVRAHSLTNDPAYETGCRRAMGLMRKPVQDGGVCWYEAGQVFLEEFPGPQRDTVLNGWIFALFGVYDFLLRFSDQEVQTLYEITCASLIRSVPEFDAGFWSYYSSGSKRMASPFYHELHLSQLQAIQQITREPSMRLRLEAWTRYANSKPCRCRALIIKGFQKIKEPYQIRVVN